MNDKMIVFDPLYCSGCMRCMTACSTYHTGSTSLSKSRIQILRHEGHALSRIDEEDDLIFDMVSCRQCDDPFCRDLCPTLAIERDRNTGALVINRDRCVGCRTCLAVCPFGAVAYDAARKQIMKCDLCSGDPQCVRFCPTEALRFLPKGLAHLPARGRMERKLNRSRQAMQNSL